MVEKTEKRCDTCINVRGSDSYAPHRWCIPQRAYFEKDHSCGQWGARDAC